MSISSSPFALSMAAVKLIGPFLSLLHHASISDTRRTLTDIPDPQSIISAGEQVLSTSTSWKQGKTFHGNVQTLRGSLPSGNTDDSWHCRVSQHNDVSFEIFWKYLGMSKPENEKQFIPEIQYVHVAPSDQVQTANPKIFAHNQTLVSSFYSFPTLVSDRVFTVLQTTSLSEDTNGMRQGIVVSIPTNLQGTALESLELDDDGRQRVRGRYVSVERFLEAKDGSVEWRMATSSTPDGLIPQWLVEKTLPNSIANDVPHFLGWLKTKLGQ